MTTTEKLNDLQNRLQEAFQQAQTRAQGRARELEQEARKVWETLGDRAQAEIRTLVLQAQSTSREQMTALGVEIEKLGKKLQDLAVAPAKTAPAVDGSATQPAPDSVQ